VVTTPGHLGTLLTVHLPVGNLADLAQGTRVMVTWETDGDVPRHRHAVGTVAQVTDLTARLERRPITDVELAADRALTVRIERLAHVPECEHGVPRVNWCEACQRDWEGE
jgi:hypothetical protein